MSEIVSISQQDATRFRDNLLRVQIMCNSLQAFAAEEGTHVAAEAKTFGRFLADELPVVMQQNEAILHEAIRARGDGDGDYATRAALGLLHEDHERLHGLAAHVGDRLRSLARSRATSGREELRHEISTFLAAQRNYMTWSRKIIDKAEAPPSQH